MTQRNKAEAAPICLTKRKINKMEEQAILLVESWGEVKGGGLDWMYYLPS